MAWDLSFLQLGRNMLVPMNHLHNLSSRTELLALPCCLPLRSYFS